jgi:hypothetical protein
MSVCLGIYYQPTAQVSLLDTSQGCKSCIWVPVYGCRKCAIVQQGVSKTLLFESDDVSSTPGNG